MQMTVYLSEHCNAAYSPRESLVQDRRLEAMLTCWRAMQQVIDSNSLQQVVGRDTKPVARRWRPPQQVQVLVRVRHQLDLDTRRGGSEVDRSCAVSLYNRLGCAGVACCSSSDLRPCRIESNLELTRVTMQSAE